MGMKAVTMELGGEEDSEEPSALRALQRHRSRDAHTVKTGSAISKERSGKGGNIPYPLSTRVDTRKF